ncbi:MAG: low temperature requirement protein A [Alphaproteobacteria bacterium]|nr:low temperature requirement protein A [Alphaproteobacteria bacterium]MBT7944459.1 low temperature requirement protein A [Alphaproteobacteria bacterium]
METIKRASWLELFFDLVFVFAIAKATHVLAYLHDGHVAWSQYGIFLLIMIPIWWAWTGHTMFATRFDTEDTGQRLLTLAQMLAAVFLAAFVNPDFDSNYHGFLFSYVAIRVLLIFMYARAASLLPEAGVISKRLSIGFSLGLLVALGSLFVDPPWRYVVLYTGFAIEIVSPLFSRKALKEIPVNAHHMPERFGLLTIILFGESVVAIAAKLGEQSWSPLTPLAAVNGFVVMTAAWWLYFDAHEERVIGQDLGAGQRILYGHLGIYCGLSILSAAIGFAISGELGIVDHAWMIGIGLVVFLGAMIFIHGRALFTTAGRRAPAAILAAASGLMLLSGHLSG